MAETARRIFTTDLIYQLWCFLIKDYKQIFLQSWTENACHFTTNYSYALFVLQ